MGDTLHEVGASEIDAFWPAVRQARLFASRDAFAEWRERQPWALRSSRAGDLVVLARWRPHLDIVHIRAAWCPSSRVADVVAAVRDAGRERGLPVVLSPLLNEPAVRPYVRAGLTRERRLVAISASPDEVRSAPLPHGMHLRPAVPGDLDAIAWLEATCFSAFWRHSAVETAPWLVEARVMVAVMGDEVIGYTLTTSSGDSGTLGRVAVAPDARERGVGAALVADAAAYLSREGARMLSLCTQESNAASRAMYASLGLREHAERLVLAQDPTSE